MALAWNTLAQNNEPLYSIETGIFWTVRPKDTNVTVLWKSLVSSWIIGIQVLGATITIKWRVVFMVYFKTNGYIYVLVRYEYMQNKYMKFNDFIRDITGLQTCEEIVN